MKHEEPKTGRPGETSQWPRWEGPAENRPSGYLQGEANIFAENSEQQKHQGVAPTDYQRPDDHIQSAVNEALTQDYFEYVVNEDLSRTLAIVDEIAHGNLSREKNEQAKAIARNLLEELNRVV